MKPERFTTTVPTEIERWIGNSWSESQATNFLASVIWIVPEATFTGIGFGSGLGRP